MKITENNGFVDFELEDKDTMSISLHQMRDLRRRDISTRRIEDRARFFEYFCMYLPLLRYLKHNGYNVVNIQPGICGPDMLPADSVDIISDGVIPKIFFPPHMVKDVDIGDGMADYDWTTLLNKIHKGFPPTQKGI